MFMSSHFLYRSACHARDKAKAAIPETHELAFNSVTAVIEAVIATEAFINELGEHLGVFMRFDPPFLKQPALAGVADALLLMEEEQGKLTLKYLLTSHLLGCPFKKGENPFQDFQTLVRVRNAIVHFKPLDKISHDEEGSPTNELPKWVVSLQGRGLARTFPEGMMVSWFIVLHTAEMATWACDTALKIILSVLDLVKDDMVSSAFSVFREDPFVGKYL